MSHLIGSISSPVERTIHITMPLFRRSRKEKKSETGDEAPFIDMAKGNLSPADMLCFDGEDPNVELKKASERSPIPLAVTPPSAPAATASPATSTATKVTVPAGLFRCQLKKISYRAPVSPAVPEDPITALFRHVKDEDKLRAWGADPISGIRHENPSGYLDPTSTNSIRFVGSSLLPSAKVGTLPRGNGPVKSRGLCTSIRVEKPSERVSYLNLLPVIKTSLHFRIGKKSKKENGPTPPLPPAPIGPNIRDRLEPAKISRPMTMEQPVAEAPHCRMSKKKIRRLHTQSMDSEGPVVQDSTSNSRFTPVDPVKGTFESRIKTAKEATESPIAPLRRQEHRRMSFRLFLQVLTSIIHHFLRTFGQCIPAWKVLRDPKVTQDEFTNAWSTILLAMVYFLALWGCYTPVGKLVCSMVEGINWVLGVISLVMVFGIFGSFCFSSKQYS